MNVPTIMTALSWFALVFAAVAGLTFVAMPLLLGQAQRAIRANPPFGPDWARRIWQMRENMYRRIIVAAVVAGTLAFILTFV